MLKLTDDMVFGIEEIDAQHRELVNMINDLDVALQTGNALTAASSVIDALVDYTSYHFSTEERYFDKFSFKQRIPHVNEHKKFVEKVGQFVSDFKSGKTFLPMEMMFFLKNWLVMHIKTVDRNYVELFREQGLH